MRYVLHCITHKKHYFVTKFNILHVRDEKYCLRYHFIHHTEIWQVSQETSWKGDAATTHTINLTLTHQSCRRSCTIQPLSMTRVELLSSIKGPWVDIETVAELKLFIGILLFIEQYLACRMEDIWSTQRKHSHDVIYRNCKTNV